MSRYLGDRDVPTRRVVCLCKLLDYLARRWRSLPDSDLWERENGLLGR